jgi:hypothetical protein
MDCLLEGMSGEADAVSPGGEGTDDHVRIPPEWVVPCLSDLLAVPPSQLVRDLGAADFQERLPSRRPVVRASAVLGHVHASEGDDPAPEDQRQRDRSPFDERTGLHRRPQSPGLLGSGVLSGDFQPACGRLAEPPGRDVAALHVEPRGRRRILARHRGGGDPVRLHEGVGVQAREVFEGAAENTRSHQSVRGNTLEADTPTLPTRCTLPVSPSGGKHRWRRRGPEGPGLVCPTRVPQRLALAGWPRRGPGHFFWEFRRKPSREYCSCSGTRQVIASAKSRGAARGRRRGR